MKSEDSRKLRFVQLYTSKSYENRRSELLNPPTEDRDDDGDHDISLAPGSGTLIHSSSADNLQKHVLSPRLVDAIAKTTQVVWANSKRQEGLIGRSDIRLQTAVGMPVAMDDMGNMCIVVMFSPNNIHSSDDAMEFLQSISRSATASSIPCLLPVFDQEASRLRQLTYPEPENHSHGDADYLGEGVTARFVSLDKNEDDSDTAEIHNAHELTDAPKDTFGIPMLPTFAELGNVTPDYDNVDIFDEASYGIWTTIMDTLNDDNLEVSFGNSMDYTFESNDAVPSVDSDLQVILPNKVNMSESRKIRLEEFLGAFLDMSVFDLADVWVPVGADYPDCLRQVTAVTSSDRNAPLDDFKSASVNTLIKFWTGAVGRAYSSGNPVWSANPDVFVDPGRLARFQKTKILTVVAIPIFSGKSAIPACVVACYSLVRSGSVPFVLRFVQQALRLLWDGLDKVEPHQSVGRSLWQDVAPADLGEMAADVEMQHHFMNKKRPRTYSVSDIEYQPADPCTTALASHLHAVSLPSGDTVNVPFDLPEQVNANTVDMAAIQNHVYEAIRSVAWAVPYDHVSTNAEGTKRAHVLPMRPLPMPQRFPTTILSSQSSIDEVDDAQKERFTMNAAVFVFPQQPTYNAVQSDTKTQFISSSAEQSSVPMNFSIPLADSNFYCLPADGVYRNPAGDGIDGSDVQSGGENKSCRIIGCGEAAASRRPYCIKHGGNRLCEFDGCNKCAQGSTRFCIAHGGGRRCTHPGCDKGARDKFFCAAHGGGKRCSSDGCNKSAVGGSTLCTAHGGGRRCDVEGCDKSAQSSTKFCVKHGGGKNCLHEGCEKVARGRTPYCAAHGGGIRCKLDGCNRVAIGKLQLCRAHGGGARLKKIRLHAATPLVGSSIMS